MRKKKNQIETNDERCQDASLQSSSSTEETGSSFLSSGEWNHVDSLKFVCSSISVEDEEEEERHQRRRASDTDSRKVRRSWTRTRIKHIHEFIISSWSKSLKAKLTFQQEREAETSTDPPRGQRSVCSWSYSSPLEGWSSLWSDTCRYTTHSQVKVQSEVKSGANGLERFISYIAYLLFFPFFLLLSLFIDKILSSLPLCVAFIQQYDGKI